MQKSQTSPQKTPESSSDFRVPSFAPQAFDFDVTPESHALYEELSQISQEIESCRAALY